jgi:hypothetical protein
MQVMAQLISTIQTYNQIQHRQQRQSDAQRNLQYTYIQNFNTTITMPQPIPQMYRCNDTESQNNNAEHTSTMPIQIEPSGEILMLDIQNDLPGEGQEDAEVWDYKRKRRRRRGIQRAESKKKNRIDIRHSYDVYDKEDY